MPHAENTVTIERPIGDVFAYLADGTNNPRWRAGVLSIERTSAGEGADATYRQVLSGPGGRKIAGDYRVTRYEPPHRLEFAVIARPARPGRAGPARRGGPRPGHPHPPPRPATPRADAGY